MRKGKDMAIKSYFFNAVKTGSTYDRVYNAEDVTSYLDLLVGNGVFPDPSTQLQARAGTGMQVIVSPGAGWINGYKLVNSADLPLSISGSDVANDRIDQVIFFVDQTTRSMGIEILEGTASPSPVAKPLTRTASRWELCLAKIYVEHQATQITAADVTDERGNSLLCGFVSGLIQQIDTATLWQQQQAAFNDWLETVQSQWAAFTQFARLEASVTTAAAGADTFDVTALIPEYAYTVDALEVYINGLHLTGAEYTNAAGTVTLTTPLADAGQVVDFVVYHLSGAPST